jgi:Ni,Fe-hydrogenase III large subunit
VTKLLVRLIEHCINILGSKREREREREKGGGEQKGYEESARGTVIEPLAIIDGKLRIVAKRRERYLRYHAFARAFVSI